MKYKFIIGVLFVFLQGGFVWDAIHEPPPHTQTPTKVWTPAPFGEEGNQK